MLTNIVKISDTTKTKFFEIIFSMSDQKIWQKNCQADLSALSDLLTCSPSISDLTRGFIGMQVIPLFTVYKFRKKQPLMFIFFFKVLQILHRFWKGRKEIEKVFFDLEIISFELVTLDTRFYWKGILLIGCRYVNKQSQEKEFLELASLDIEQKKDKNTSIEI